MNEACVVMTEDDECVLRRYCDYVVKADAVRNLTTARSGEDFYNEHVIPVIAAVPHFQKHAGKLIHDIGSGSGIPGIPLAVMLKDRRFVLVERSRARAMFLKSAVCVAGIAERVSVLEGDFKALGCRMDTVTFTALGDFGKLGADVYAGMNAGGVALLFKGRRSVCESEDYGMFSSSEFVSLSETPKERTLVVLRK